MKKVSRHLLRPATPFLLAAVLSCVFSSCSSSEAQLNSEEDSVTFPAKFEEGGTKWTKLATVSEAELIVLSEYFKKNSSMAEGPLISGDPTLYTSNGVKRFYWGRQGANAPEWVYIQFEGRKATVKEGSGSPLVKSSS